ncbi:hypothetical protein PY38_00230, partial [Staphylococcus aureus]
MGRQGADRLDPNGSVARLSQSRGRAQDLGRHAALPAAHPYAVSADLRADGDGQISHRRALRGRKPEGLQRGDRHG